MIFFLTSFTTCSASPVVKFSCLASCSNSLVSSSWYFLVLLSVLATCFLNISIASGLYSLSKSPSDMPKIFCSFWTELKSLYSSPQTPKCWVRKSFSICINSFLYFFGASLSWYLSASCCIWPADISSRELFASRLFTSTRKFSVGILFSSLSMPLGSTRLLAIKGFMRASFPEHLHYEITLIILSK